MVVVACSPSPGGGAAAGTSSACLNRTERDCKTFQGQKVAINTSRSWSGWRPWGEQNVITHSGIQPGPPVSTRGHCELSRKPRPLSYLLPMKRRGELKFLSGGGICSPWWVLIFFAGFEPENQNRNLSSKIGSLGKKKKLKTHKGLLRVMCRSWWSGL